ncbi:unnamed protein product [Amoebophrya sp. A120]|nr:unnamed protein product [Amoebophrya sp. A120]|eukprot:GSA120T00019119001.1
MSYIHLITLLTYWYCKNIMYQKLFAGYSLDGTYTGRTAIRCSAAFKHDLRKAGGLGVQRQIGRPHDSRSNEPMLGVKINLTHQRNKDAAESPSIHYAARQDEQTYVTVTLLPCYLATIRPCTAGPCAAVKVTLLLFLLLLMTVRQ